MTIYLQHCQSRPVRSALRCGVAEAARGAVPVLTPLPCRCLPHRTYIARVDRPLMAVLMQRLQALGARTTDGSSADYFLVPFLLRQRRDHDVHLAQALAYVQQAWPFWRRDNGSRHLIVAQGDARGGDRCRACSMGRAGAPGDT